MKNYLKTEDYRNAISGEGELSHEWNDKPHRLIFDLCSEVERLQLILIENNLIEDVFMTSKGPFNDPYQEFIKPNIEKIKNTLNH